MPPTSGLLDPGRASVFFDGTVTDPQLDHPEGVAVHGDGSVWCGGERGQVFRVDPDGGSITQVASTGGFCLGMAFGPGGDLFVCDLKHACVFRVETATGRVERFADGAGDRPLRIPNSPAFDADGRLYVSDSHQFDRPGPGVFRFGPDGRGELWYGGELVFANGLAVAPDGRHLYVAETFANRVSRIPVGDDGAAGTPELVAATPGAWPDGLAFDVEGNLYVGCYEPSQVLRVDPAGRVEVLFREWSAHLLAHPTNLAFRGTTMFTANLGRWHLTRLEVGVEGLALPPGLAVTVLRGITWDHVRGLGGLEATAAAWAAARPGVRVEWTTRSLQAFADQPVDQLARRFDLIYLDHPALGEAVARASLVPLDEHLDRATLAVQVAGSVGRSAGSYTWEGHRWALATDAAAQVAAYRPDLLRRAGVAVPRTWPEALEVADALRRAGLWAALPAIPVDAVCAFLAVCAALGEAPFGAGQVISHRTGRSALRLLAALLERCHPDSLAWNPPRMLEHMSGSDDVAWCPLAFGYVNYARPGFRDHLVLAAPPPAGGDGVPRGTLGGAGLAVSAHSAAVAEAVAYAAYVAGPEVQRTTYFRAGGQPGHRSAWTDEAVNVAASGFFHDTLRALDAALLRPRHDGFLGFQEAAGELVHGFLRRGGDPDRVLEAMEAAWRASLPAPVGRG